MNKKPMKYEEFIQFLSNFIEEPNTVKDEFLSQFFNPHDDGVLYIVDIEQDGTIKASVSPSMEQQNNYVINVNQDLRKYDLSYDVKYTDFRIHDTKSYQMYKFHLEYSDNIWDNQPGYIIDKEERTSNYLREKDDATGKIDDYMWQTKRIFDENGIEMNRNHIKTEYPVRENQSKFTFGVPEFNSRTAIKTINNSTYRNGLTTAVEYITVSEPYVGITENKTNFYLLNREHGSLPLLGTRFAISEELCKEYQAKDANCSIDELDDDVFSRVEEPMRSGLLERYGIADTNCRGRR